MKQLTIETIRSYEPCYDPIKHINEDFKGTVLDILNNNTIPPQDRLWVALRQDLLSDKLLRLFAVWCARQVVQHNNDPRVINAIEVAERYAHGNTTIEELDAACIAVRSAARSTAWAATWPAAEPAARSAAEYAARSAEYAAWDATWPATWPAAESAARSAAWSAQIDKLKEMVIEGIDTGDVK